MALDDPAAKFVGYAKWMLTRIESTTEPLWWRDIEPLTFQLETFRRELLAHDKMRDDFISPAFLIASASRESGFPFLAQAHDEQMLKRFPWLLEITTMFFSDPCDHCSGWNVHLCWKIDEVAHEKWCLVEGSEDELRDDWHSDFLADPEFPCREIGRNEFCANEKARRDAIQCLQRWIEAVESLNCMPLFDDSVFRYESIGSRIWNGGRSPRIEPDEPSEHLKRGVSIMSAALTVENGDDAMAKELCKALKKHTYKLQAVGAALDRKDRKLYCPEQFAGLLHLLGYVDSMTGIVDDLRTKLEDCRDG